jgi:hypothetical protein
MFALIHLIGLAFTLLLAPLILLVFIFWLWMLIHAVTSKGLSDGEKVGWVLVILFLHFIGALIYFFFGRQRGMVAV